MATDLDRELDRVLGGLADAVPPPESTAALRTRARRHQRARAAQTTVGIAACASLVGTGVFLAASDAETARPNVAVTPDPTAPSTTLVVEPAPPPAGFIPVAERAVDDGPPDAWWDERCEIRAVAAGSVSVATPSGAGSWTVDECGRVELAGDAQFFGDLDTKRLSSPIAAFAVSPNGDGYILMSQDGGLFTIGAATFWGSRGAIPGPPMLSIEVPANGDGYTIVDVEGNEYVFNSATSGVTTTTITD